MGRKKYVHINSNPTKFIVEIYNYAHYFTVTGNVYGQPKPIASRTQELKTLYEKFFVEHKPETQAPQPKETNSSTPKNPTPTTSNQQSEYFSSENLSDN